MNIKETIRAEIERLSKSIENATGDFAEGRRLEQRVILSILDTLEEPVSYDLEEAADEYSGDPNTGFIDMTAYRAFKAGAEWMKKQIPMPEDTDIFQKGVEEGKRLIMEGAVEGKVFMSFAPGHNQMVIADVDLPTNTKVKVIVVKEDGK